MKSYGPALAFRHMDDCIQRGCPAHTLRAVYNHTIDRVQFEVDGELTAGFDPHEWAAMIHSFDAMEYVPEWIKLARKAGSQKKGT